MVREHSLQLALVSDYKVEIRLLLNSLTSVTFLAFNPQADDNIKQGHCIGYSTRIQHSLPSVRDDRLVRHYCNYIADVSDVVSLKLF